MKHNLSYNDKIKYFDDLAPIWDEKVGNDQKRKNRIKEIFQDISLNNGMTVLDVGCGNGESHLSIINSPAEVKS